MKKIAELEQTPSTKGQRTTPAKPTSKPSQISTPASRTRASGSSPAPSSSSSRAPESVAIQEDDSDGEEEPLSEAQSTLEALSYDCCMHVHSKHLHVVSLYENPAGCEETPVKTTVRAQAFGSTECPGKYPQTVAGWWQRQG